MTILDKPLLFLAGAGLSLAFVITASWAQSAADSRTGPGKAQAAPAQNNTLVAQGFARPPGEINEGADVPYPGEQPDGAQSDSAGLLVRIGRLESQMRQLNGQIEQMQFETRRLEEQLKKFQEDVDFRFHENAPGAPAASPPQKRGEAPMPQMTGANEGLPQSAAVAPSPTNRHSDAFDPSQNPTAPGAPRPLGSLASAAGTGAAGGWRAENGSPALDQSEPGAPLDLSNGRSRMGAAPVTTPIPPGASPGVPPSGAGTSDGTVIAALPNSPKEEFGIAMAYLKQRAFENAEKGFVRFLEKNPKDRLAPDATYFLGESLFLRGRHREAAEQYLKIPTQYPSSQRAPEALLRLGQSLGALGAKEQACATFGEITRKYPNAPAMVKAGAEREVKRAQC
jgi:tol-pal system protein YbgF